MAKKRFRPEQVIAKLRQINVLIGEYKNLRGSSWIRSSDQGIMS